MILDDAIADDLRALGFETTRYIMGPPDAPWTDFFLPTNPDWHFLRLKYKFDFEKRTCEIGNIDVHPDYRSGRGIGRTVIQRISRTAIDHDIQRIKLKGIIGDGFTFWPRLGAIPVEDCTAPFRRALFNVVARGHSYTRQDVASLSQAKERLRSGASINELWRSLSAKPEHGGLTNRCLSRISKETLGLHENMTLRLKDPVVLTRLGLTPRSEGS